MTDFLPWVRLLDTTFGDEKQTGAARVGRRAHCKGTEMRKVAALAAVAFLATIARASAADMSRSLYAAPASYGAYSWVGPYLGFNLGYQWGSATQSGARPSGLMGGIQGGYNWQIGQFVFGGETDIQLSSADDTFAAWKFSNPWFGTLRARAGYAMSNVLLYATFGLAYGGGTVETGGLKESNT